MITHVDIGYNGRLGNQLFNYALLLALREKGHQVAIPQENCNKIKEQGCFDAYSKTWLSYRCVLYDYFNLTIPQYPAEQLTTALVNVVTEKSFDYDESILSISDNTSLRGYFQSYKYFNNIRNAIKSEFEFKRSVTERIDYEYTYDLTNSVAVHIRLGDTLAQSWVYKLNPEHISKAFEMLADTQIDNILVFSDNVELCRDWFPKDESVHFVEYSAEAESLYLMTRCKHFIMSPSTYSWWGAYLGEKKDSKIIFPQTWFSDGRNLNDLLLPNWATI